MNTGFVGYVCLLLNICTLVSPFTSPRHAQEKRGFRVPVRRRAFEPAGALTKRHAGGGTVKFDDGGWFTSALISGQELTLTIDSGSADMWVASTLMPPRVQNEVTTGKIFNPNTSATFRTKEGYTFEVHFGDGSSAQGPIGIDEVSIGEAVVTHMPFGTCSSWSFSTVSTNGTRDTTGLLGLAFRSISTASPEPDCTFMECLLPSLSEPIFSTSFSYDKTGFLDFGFIDDEAYTGDFSTLAIDNSTGFWQVNEVHIGSGGKRFNAKAEPAVFDTGTTWLYLPSSAVTAYASLVEGAKYDNLSAAYKCPCESQLPDLELTFDHAKGGPATAVVPGSNLKYGPFSSECYLSLSSNTYIGFSLLGSPFFANRYVVFNQSEPSMLFANATGKGTTTPPAKAPQKGPLNTPPGGRHDGAEHKHNKAAQESASLSTGAQAGIGIAVAVVGLVLIAVGIWAFLRRKKRRSESGAAMDNSAYSGKPELEGQGAEARRSELPSENITEMPGPVKLPEMSEDVRHELPGDDPARELSAGSRHDT